MLTESLTAPDVLEGVVPGDEHLEVLPDLGRGQLVAHAGGGGRQLAAARLDAVQLELGQQHRVEAVELHRPLAPPPRRRLVWVGAGPCQYQCPNMATDGAKL